MAPRSSRFAHYLLAAYWLLIVYGSLYPWSGWRDQGSPAFEFLTAPLPHWYTLFDIVVNLAVYFPLGFLVVLAAQPRLPRAAVSIGAGLAAAATSIALEVLQNYLPNRIPSNLEVAAIVCGAVMGAAAGGAARRWLIERRGLFDVRDRWFVAGARVDLGLVLIALWLFTQINPATLLFGNGDLRAFIDAPVAELHAAQTFVRVETAVAAANIVALAAMLALLANAAQPIRALLLAIIAAGLATRAVAFAILFGPTDPLAWLTPGAMAGLGAGLAGAMVVVALPRVWAAAACGLALMAAAALVNLAPDNPYLAQSLAAWPQGHFLHLNGLTRLVSTLWPFATLVYLLAVATRIRGDRLG